MDARDLRLLKEKYFIVQEQEQVWQHVQQWARKREQQGHNLSGFTREELTEAFFMEHDVRTQLVEQGGPNSRPQLTNRSNDGGAKQIKDLLDKSSKAIQKTVSRPIQQAASAGKKTYDAIGDTVRNASAAELARTKANPGGGGKGSRNRYSSNVNFKNRMQSPNSSSAAKDDLKVDAPKPTPNSSASSMGSSSSATSRAVSKPVVKQTGDRATDMAVWRKSNPTLAKRLDTKNASRIKATPKVQPSTGSSGSTGSARLDKALTGISRFEQIENYYRSKCLSEEEIMQIMVRLDTVEAVDHELRRIKRNKRNQEKHDLKYMSPKEVRKYRPPNAERDNMDDVPDEDI